jgi:hypothetical protein
LAKALLEEATALFLNDDLVAQIHPITGDAGVLAVSASPVMPASARIAAGVRPICVQDSLGDGPLVHRRHRRRRSVSSSRIRDGISPIRRSRFRPRPLPITGRVLITLPESDLDIVLRGIEACADSTNDFIEMQGGLVTVAAAAHWSADVAQL